jgi:cytochrome c556
MNRIARIASLALAAAVASLSLPASADDAKQEAIKYRQAVFKVVGWNFKPMGAMVKGETPYDKASFQRMADNLAFASKLALEGFAPGTDALAGETRAKDDIWKKNDDFKSKMAEFEKASAALAQAAQGGDMAAIKPAFGKTADTCKSCHKAYRED